jgi:hypothetical protein
MSALLRLADSTRTSGHVRDVPNCDIADVARKEKAARRRLSISILMIVDQAAIKAGFDFLR